MTESENNNPAEETGAHPPAPLTEETAGATTDAAAGTPKRPGKTDAVMREVLDWAKSIGAALVLALVLKAVVIQAYVIPTGSMEPTIMPRDRVFGNRFIYHFQKPRPGDIIAFVPPDKALWMANMKKGTSFLKRVIAVEGDSLYISDGIVFLNGKPLDEPYEKEPPMDDFDKVVVPAGKVFVMGDNRNNSLDSRRWEFLPVESIQARAFFRFWPPNRMGALR